MAHVHRTSHAASRNAARILSVRAAATSATSTMALLMERGADIDAREAEFLLFLSKSKINEKFRNDKKNNQVFLTFGVPSFYSNISDEHCVQ